jgi:hypothetical protein
MQSPQFEATHRLCITLAVGIMSQIEAMLRNDRENALPTIGAYDHGSIIPHAGCTLIVQFGLPTLFLIYPTLL